MTKCTKKTVSIITIMVFVLAAVVFLAWGTCGFTNWDAKQWFNSWGKGSLKTVETLASNGLSVQSSNTQSMDKSVMQTDLSYDSDDSDEITISVEQARKPSFKPYLSDYNTASQKGVFYFYAYKNDSVNGSYLSVDDLDEVVVNYSVAEDDDTGSYSTYTRTYQFQFKSAGGSLNSDTLAYLYIDYAEIANCLLHAKYLHLQDNIEEYNQAMLNDPNKGYDTVFQLSFYGQKEGYSQSDLTNVGNLYLPAEDKVHLNITVEDMVVTIPMPFDYEYNNDVAGVHCQNALGLTFTYANNYESPRVILNLDSPGYCDDDVVYKDYYDLNQGTPFYKDICFSLHNESGNCYYTLDLRKLPIDLIVGKIYLISVVPINTCLDELRNCKILFDYESPQFLISQLATPTNLSYNNGLLTWDEVDGAEGYTVFIGSNSFTTYTNTYNIKNYGFDVGNYTVRVRALGNLGRSLAETNEASLTAYNASLSVQQIVCLNLNIDGDIITKLVPYGSTLSDYLYEVDVPDKVFGGWFYDSGFSEKVNADDVLKKDTTIYARLSDSEVTERNRTWWEKYNLFVIIPAAVLLVFGIVAYIVISKKKQEE